jgi:hypothetical protein
MKPFRIAVTFFLLASCGIVRNFTSRIEESHNALYIQKALFVYAVDSHRVYFTNPTHTRCYFLKGREYTKRWVPGDTMIIENNLEDFYKLKYARQCDM